MRAVIYARVSSDDQADRGYSLPTQLASCRRYAAEQHHVVIAEFQDDCSGTIPMAERPEGAKALALLNRHEADVIIVHVVDRLSRDLVDTLTYVRDWLRAGVLVYACDMGQIKSDSDIRLVIGGWQAATERLSIIERTSRGRRGKAEAGFYVGGGQPPYGFCKVERDGRIHLELDEREAFIVRRIYEWYVYGDETGRPLSLYGIARKLSARGIASPGVARHSPKKKSESSYWSVHTVAAIIHSETYKGTWNFGRVKWTGRKPKGQPRSEWTPVSVPAIVDEKLWKAAQTKAAQNKHCTRPHLNGQYLLQARLKCANCGHALKGISQKPGNGCSYPYYSCAGTQRDNGTDWECRTCAARMIRADVADSYAWDWLKLVLLQPEKLLAGVRLKQAEQHKESRIAEERLGVIEGELEGARAKLGRLIDLFTDGTSEMTKALFGEKEKELNEQIHRLGGERDVLREQVAAPVLTDEMTETVESLAADVCLAFESATPEEKRTLVEILDVRGLVKPLNKLQSELELSCELNERAVRTIRRLYGEDADSLRQSSNERICKSCYNGAREQLIQGRPSDGRAALG